MYSMCKHAQPSCYMQPNASILVIHSVQWLVGHLIVLDSLLKVTYSSIHIYILVVWTAQLHLLLCRCTHTWICIITCTCILTHTCTCTVYIHVHIPYNTPCHWHSCLWHLSSPHLMCACLQLVYTRKLRQHVCWLHVHAVYMYVPHNAAWIGGKSLHVPLCSHE